MKKTFYIQALSLCCLPLLVQAQLFNGFHTSNYAGVSSIQANPANIVDSRYLVDINLVGFDFALTNNYLGLDTKLFRLGSSNPLLDTNYTGRFQDFRGDYFAEKEDREARLYQTLNIQGPAFSFQVGKNAFALTTAVRQSFFIDNLERRTASFILDELRDPALWNVMLDNQQFNAVAAAWSEVGFVYGREIYNEGPHYLKAAINAKFLLAGASSYFYADNLLLDFRNNDTLSVRASDVRFGYSNNLRDGDILQEPYVRNLINRGSFAFDFGAVYEWRPNYKDYRREDDSTKWRKDVNKYKLKASFGLHDVGWLRFDRGTYAGNFEGGAVDWDLNSIDVAGIESFAQLLQDTFNMSSSREPYRIRLPTAISMQVDYHVWKGFYTNFTSYIAFNQNDAPLRLHALSQFTLTPRYEHKWFDVAVPLGLDGYGNAQAGLSLRLGPLFIGSMNGLNYVFGDKVRGLNIYSGLKVPIPYGKKKKKIKELPEPDTSAISKRDSLQVQPVERLLKDGELVKPENPMLNPKEMSPEDSAKVEEPVVVDKEPEFVPPAPPAPDSTKADTTVSTPGKIAFDPNRYVYEPPYYKLKDYEFVFNDTTVFFATGSWTLNAENRATLKPLADQLKEYPQLKIIINGYADNVGDAEYNKKLSVRRADAVAAYFEEQGIGKERITADAFGASEFIADNTSEKGRRQNRRVEMVLVAEKDSSND